MRTLRILFMGTPDFAVATLKQIIENDYTVVAVVTAPDKPAGRGRKLRMSKVKEFALAHDLKVLQPTNLKDQGFINTLKTLAINLNIVVAFRMLPEVVWRLPEFGTFNLHASLLPEYRGAAPINWVLINGETKTGNTTFFIDEKIDTGAIIMQNQIAIEKDDTAGTLHDKLMVSGAALVLETLASIANNKIQTTLQTEPQRPKTAYKLHKENTKIDWNTDAQTIHNLIRGLNPYPGAWCYLENAGTKTTVKLFDTLTVNCEHAQKPGAILIEGVSLKVATKKGYVVVKSIQLSGKRIMDTKALLNGYHFEKNSKFL